MDKNEFFIQYQKKWATKEENCWQYAVHGLLEKRHLACLFSAEGPLQVKTVS